MKDEKKAPRRVRASKTVSTVTPPPDAAASFLARAKAGVEADAALERARASHAAYNRVVRSAQLTTVRLVQMNYELHPEYFDTQGEHPVVAHKLSYGGELIADHADKDRGVVVGVYRWWVDVKAKADESSRMRFVCTYLIEYAGLELAEATAEEAAKSFVRRVGKFAVFPYVRSLLSLMSGESGADLPPLPVLTEGTAATQMQKERLRGDLQPPVADAAPKRATDSDTNAKPSTRGVS